MTEPRRVRTSRYPVSVWVWFGRPIQPRHRARVPWLPEPPAVLDPPVDQDELFGLLLGWRKGWTGPSVNCIQPNEWWASVQYGYPVHGYGFCNFLGPFPAHRLRPADSAAGDRPR